jgi:O-antigen/teichoic acid export membrane protein
VKSIAEEEMGYGRYLVKGGGITFIGLIVIAASQFGVRVFLAQGLGKEHFGLFFAVFTFLAFLNIFSHLGLNRAVTRFVSKFRVEGKPDRAKSSILSSLSVVAGVSFLISAVVIGLSSFLASSYFGLPDVAVPILIILSVWFFFMSFHKFLLAVSQGFKDFFTRTLGEIVRDLTPLIGVVVLIIFFELNLTSVATFYLLGSILSISLLYILLRRRHPKVVVKASGSVSKSLSRKMLAFGMPLVISGVAVSVIGRTDTLMLTGLRSLGDVGLYQAARLTKPVLMYFGTSLAIPLFPMVSELWAKKDKRTLRKTLSLMTKFSFILIVPIALIFLAFPETIIRIFLGSEYLAAANAMRILTVAAIFWVIGIIFEAFLSGIGKTTLVFKSIGTAAIFNIVANLLLIPPYGATGAALATGMSFLITFVLFFYYSRRNIKFPLPLLPWAKIGAGGVLTLLLIFSLKSILPLPTWPLLFAVLIPSALFYIGWLFMARIIGKEDLDVIEASVPMPKKLASILRRLSRD